MKVYRHDVHRKDHIIYDWSDKQTNEALLNIYELSCESFKNDMRFNMILINDSYDTDTQQLKSVRSPHTKQICIAV